MGKVINVRRSMNLQQMQEMVFGEGDVALVVKVWQKAGRECCEISEQP